jgi:hypothetical protein
MDIEPEYYCARRAARYLDSSESTLAKLRLDGGGPRFSRIGRRGVRYKKSDLDEFVAATAAASTSSRSSQPMNCIYHYTDTIRLPWILESRQLRPSPNRIGGYPPDFLWATSDKNGDRTSSAAGKTVRKLWREGHLLPIRFVLDPADFEDWEPVAQATGWTEDQIKALKRSARSLGESNTTKWRCRPYALPIAKVLRIEAKSFASKDWAAINRPTLIASKEIPDFRAVVIGGFAYGGIRKDMAHGGVAYDPVRRLAIPIPQEAAMGLNRENEAP